jgi:hypothetical protein
MEADALCTHLQFPQADAQAKICRRVQFCQRYIISISTYFSTTLIIHQMKKLILIASIIFATSTVFAQDVIYTISGEINQTKTPLDSILVENLSNGTSSLFDNLPEHDFYQINLTQNAYWGTVGISDINQSPQFAEVQNLPGKLAVNWLGNSPVEVRLSVFTVSGQLVYAATKRMVYPGTSLNIHLGSHGVFLIRLNAPLGSQTFKAVGAGNSSQTSVEITAQNIDKTQLKGGVATVENDFNFNLGDSIRISAFKNEYYARPIGKKIVTSENINFPFEVSSTVTDSISDAYVALNEITTDVTSYDTLTGSVQITFTDDNPGLQPGDIITVDADTIGYLRKVIKAIEEDDTLTVETEQAYLNELFVDKDFKLHTGLMNPGVQLKSTSSAEEISKALTDEKGYIHPVEVIYKEASGELITKSALTGISENNEVIPIIDFYRDLARDLYGKEGDDVHFYIDEGHVSLTSDAIFEFDFDYEGELTEDTKVKKGDINTFSFYLDSHAEFLTKLALDMNASYEKEQERKLIDLQSITAKFLIGPVPFWVTFNVDIFGNYHINADGALNADWGFESNHDLKIGSTYNRHTDEFTSINEYEPENTVYPLNIDGEINASARFEVYPRAEIKFYSFFGPYAEIVPYAQGNYNATMQNQTTSSGTEPFLAWNSGIDLGLDFRTGIKLTFLGLNIPLVPIVINGPVWPLWKSPTNITLISTLPTETTAGNVIPLKFKVTDLQGDPVTLCAVYINGDGTFSKQLIITNTSGEASTNWTTPNSSGNNTFSATIYKADKTVIESKDYTLQVSSTAPSVTTLSATNVGETSAKLNANVTSDGGSTITQRGFYWSSTDQTPDSGDNKTVVSGTTGSYYKNISGLAPNTTYYYRAFASNSQGTSVGNINTFKTNTGVIVLKNDDGNDEKIISWIIYDVNKMPSTLFQNEDNSFAWGFWAGFGPETNPLADNKYGFSVTFSPNKYPFKINKIMFYFPKVNAVKKGIYLHIWNEDNNNLIGNEFLIPSNEISSTGWWEKDISNLNITINSGNFKVGYCQTYLEFYAYPNTPIPFPPRPVDLGTDVNNKGKSELIVNGHFHNYDDGNFMIRVEGE